MTVAALFVQEGGCYYGIDDVDPWPESRDARLYDGPWPVVAHPPCQLWVNYAALNFKRYGGEHNRPGNDGGCFASALASVRKWGGVLEHPASSNAWRTHGLTRPTGIGWQANWDGYGSFVCEVWQSAYGHRARKRTWLYIAGGGPCPLNSTGGGRLVRIKSAGSTASSRRSARKQQAPRPSPSATCCCPSPGRPR